MAAEPPWTGPQRRGIRRPTKRQRRDAQKLHRPARLLLMERALRNAISHTRARQCQSREPRQKAMVRTHPAEFAWTIRWAFRRRPSEPESDPEPDSNALGYNRR